MCLSYAVKTLCQWSNKTYTARSSGDFDYSYPIAWTSIIYVGIGNFSSINYDLSLRVIGYNDSLTLFGADYGYYKEYNGNPLVDFLFIGY